MTFPLGSLRAEGAASGNTYTRKSAAKSGLPVAVPAAPAARWRQQAWVIVGAVAWLLLLLALATHHLGDPGFSTSGDGESLRNKAGMVGAWVSDLGLFLFGYSVWWFIPVGLRAWLSSLAKAVRREDDATLAAPLLPRAAFWAGLALLMAASCSLEWTRLYQWEPQLPGHAGGVLGFTLGPLSSHWLGFAGSGVLWIAALVAGMALALGFSWLALAEVIGTAIDGLRERRQKQKERAEDRRIGEQALVDREHDVEVERQEVVDHLPLVIEPTLLEVPKSERVAKERQKPLFVELADTRLPQVDLLDAAPARVETVTPESLEMTSRLIEKKLKDFGV
jgi:S-DNA-T family DNA segregation ATPase FtsK/SpoIIIE